MGKKKAGSGDAGKARVELRLDKSVADGMTKLASDVGVSVNQLMQVITGWLVEHAHVGEALFLPDDTIGTAEAPGLVWFGNADFIMGESETGDVFIVDPPNLAFQLDFSDRRHVRDDIRRRRKERS